MKKLLLFLVLISNAMFAQMPDISNVWLNNGKSYSGTIGSKNQQITLKIEISEQDKKNDQEYFISGYTQVDNNYTKFEGKFKIKKYRDSGKKGTVYGEYELAEEYKGKHSGMFRGKFVYTFRWDKSSEKIVEQNIKLTGNWKSYDNTLDFKTIINNQ
ncbi:hypothetical protein [Chryseobacterium profundimaris]|uniref:DUF2147 domain-containing protein n=1 Tax=Chryseobacterium profundimaris TaxID=1387275 RepID=A0ABY1NKD9_9FLAO|nr:hypothetical protein [Chryseobacterium profundimaris]SMP11682.1 hypothetical protein SAMN06264346_102379 [Chryseobacterium profundimaris]